MFKNFYTKWNQANKVRVKEAKGNKSFEKKVKCPKSNRIAIKIWLFGSFVDFSFSNTHTHIHINSRKSGDTNLPWIEVAHQEEWETFSSKEKQKAEREWVCRVHLVCIIPKKKAIKLQLKADINTLLDFFRFIQKVREKVQFYLIRILNEIHTFHIRNSFENVKFEKT